jgi:thiamine phosphate synthase YjbQ (UPF0047 family)
MIKLEVTSVGLNSHYDITDLVAHQLREHAAGAGLTGIFAHGSTIGLTIMRYEPGATADLLAALDRLAPVDKPYLHGLTTGDPNGFSHVKSSFLGTSVLVPFTGAALAMSDKHRIVLFDFDLAPAVRKIFLDPPRKEA